VRLIYIKMVFISMMWVTTDTIGTCEVQLFSRDGTAVSLLQLGQSRSFPPI
jgi:hypothetical protein